MSRFKRKLTNTGSKILHSEEKFTVKVESNVGCYNKLNEMLCNLFIEQTTDKSIILNLSEVKMGEDNHKIIYNIPLDAMINVEYCGKIIECCVNQISKDHGGNGVTKIDGLITIITTNHIERLDAALTRPCHIDMSIKFIHISEEQVIGLLNLYEIKLNDRNFKELVKKCTLNKLSPSVLSGFMFRYRDQHLNDSNYITYFCEYLEEIKTATNMKSDSSSMYM